MTANFVTFYLILVLITGPFFQYLPVATYLKWDEVLLAKILNQAPTIFLLGYLIFPLNEEKRKVIWLLILFLISCIIPEAYHYIIHPDNQFIVVVVSNIVSYVILLSIFLSKKNSFNKAPKSVWASAIGFTILVAAAFSFSGIEIFQYYMPARPFTFLILISFLLIASFLVFLSFFVNRPFKRTWYELVIGVLAIIAVDIYVYSCFFVLNSQPNLLYTYGKVFFSIGLLLVVDGLSRQKNNKPMLFN
jgi:hypothetical protein